jgi:hypothetical protein
MGSVSTTLSEFDSSQGFRDFIEYDISNYDMEAEALRFHSTFVVENRFTGYGQVSATPRSEPPSDRGARSPTSATSW